MKADIIIGANLGDEGKGTIVAKQVKNSNGSTLNILTNGGSQRAHSILTEDGSFTFQHFGSGTYHGADSYFSEYYIINPIQFVKEYEELTSRGITLKDKVYRHPQCMWSTPFDMMANQIREDDRKTFKQGSCGMGIWETIKRYKCTLCVSFDDFINMDDMSKTHYIKCIRDEYYIPRLPRLTEEWRKIWYDDGIITHFISDCKFMKDATTILLKPEGYDNLVFENGQGLLLTDRGIDEAGRTPSNTGSTDAINLITKWNLDNLDKNDITLHYITRPYLTRHGKGFMSDEMDRKNISSSINEDRTNHFNKFQDEFRFGKLDLEKLKDRIEQDAGLYKTVIDVTHCDEMDREKEFKDMFKNVTFTDTPLI